MSTPPISFAIKFRLLHNRRQPALVKSRAACKQVSIRSLNDPVIQGIVPIGHVSPPLLLNNNSVIDSSVVIVFSFLLVNAKSQKLRNKLDFFFQKAAVSVGRCITLSYRCGSL